jgi:hypothetical protein
VFGTICDQWQQLVFPVVSQIWSSILRCCYIDAPVATLTEMKFIGKRLSVTPTASVGSGHREQVACLGAVSLVAPWLQGRPSSKR